MLDEVAEVDEAGITTGGLLLPAGGFDDGIMLGIIGFDELPLGAAEDEELTPGAEKVEEPAGGPAEDEIELLLLEADEVAPELVNDEELPPVAGVDIAVILIGADDVPPEVGTFEIPTDDELP